MTLSDRLRSSPLRLPHRPGGGVRSTRRGRARRTPGVVFRNASLGGLISKSTPFFADFVCGSINARNRYMNRYMNRYRVIGQAFSCPTRFSVSSPRPSHLHDLFVQVDAGVCTGTLPNAKRHRAQVEEAIQATLRADQEASAPLAACPSVPSTPVRISPPPRHFGVTFGITRSIPTTQPDHLSGAQGFEPVRRAP